LTISTDFAIIWPVKVKAILIVILAAMLIPAIAEAQLTRSGHAPSDRSHQQGSIIQPVFDTPKFEGAQFVQPQFKDPKVTQPQWDQPTFVHSVIVAPSFVDAKYDQPQIIKPQFDDGAIQKAPVNPSASKNTTGLYENSQQIRFGIRRGVARPGGGDIGGFQGIGRAQSQPEW